MRPKMAGLVAAVALAMPVGAAAQEALATPLTVTFDPATFAWAKTRGGNTITGDAVLRTRGGDVKTCAGLDAELLPATPYTDEFVARTFGAPGGGYVGRYTALKNRLVLDQRLSEFRVNKKCNGQGAFTFSGLPDGKYYVIATVTWEAPRVSRYTSYMSTQGGDLAQLVEVKGGQTETITLTQ